MFILRKIFSFFIDTAQTLLLFASFFVFIYIFFFRPFQVNGDSMFPNFHDKEYILTDLISLRFDELKKGDVIVFRYPLDEEKDFIKRIIAVAGDTILLKDNNIYINNEKLDQHMYLNSDVKTYPSSFLKEGIPLSVPENMYFVMGDNRPYSSDSREWGFVKKNEVIGRSLFAYWPLDRIRRITNPY
ncbi:MAG: signal peptidase I [Candidatus Levyibacteriota bacterium]